MKARRRSAWLALAAASLFLATGAISCAQVLGLGSYKDCCKPIGVGEPPDCVYCSSEGGQGGAPAQCEEPKDCPAVEDVCKTPTCSNHQCGIAAVPTGTPVVQQMVGDCQEVQCDGSGSTKTVHKDADVDDDGKECTSDVCTNGKPSHPSRPARTACTEGGGKMCDGHGACVACVDGSDCASTICQTGKCVAASCTDGVKNNDESAIDCGGSCGTCPDGDTCNHPSDCQGGACNGGICCTPTICAALGATCGAHADGCGGMLDCDDSAKNGTETDVDCGGTSCKPCTQGQQCGANSDCDNGRCADGYCCNTTCATACYACNIAGSEGTCSFTPVNKKDPPNCDTDSGGNLACDGAGVCLYGGNHPCSTASQCVSHACEIVGGAVHKTCVR